VNVCKQEYEMLPLIGYIIFLESKHGLKPAKKIRVGFLVVFLGPWQTSGVTESMESSLDLGIAHDSLVGAVRIEREDIVREI